jgi:hypothetical protein
MILKIRVFRLAIRTGRACYRVIGRIEKIIHFFVDGLDKLARLNWRKGCRLIAKIAAIGTTITGAVTALTSSSSATGIALGAAGATGGVVVTHGIPVKGYEKIKHVSPAKNRAMGVNMQPKLSIGSNKRHTVQKPTTNKR